MSETTDFDGSNYPFGFEIENMGQTSEFEGSNYPFEIENMGQTTHIQMGQTTHLDLKLKIWVKLLRSTLDLGVRDGATH